MKSIKEVAAEKLFQNGANQLQLRIHQLVSFFSVVQNESLRI
jgi:hypothetical protein